MDLELPVVTSQRYDKSFADILQYGSDTFGVIVAQRFFEQILELVNSLKCNYLVYPECRYIVTQKKSYRNIIIGSYIIIYRITPYRIEVLEILSSYRSITKIKAARKIKL